MVSQAAINPAMILDHHRSGDLQVIKAKAMKGGFRAVSLGK
jgi:hypothetical protein